MRNTILPCLLLLGFLTARGQSDTLRIEPPHWWTGMHRNDLLLVLHEPGIGTWTPSLSSDGIRIDSVHPCPNPNYLFLALSWDERFRPGTIRIRLSRNGQARELPYEFRPRDPDFRPGGLSPADMVYLITPDRFANGEPANDVVPGMRQARIDRKEPYQRHGGDIQGITKHLDHIRELGATAIWVNPVYTNDEPEASYHGYAITDHYHVDPRLGGDAAYAEFVQQSHARGLKVIKDVVYNHFGDKHHLILDQPFPGWVFPKDAGKCNFRAYTLVDPYASEHDRKRFLEGWFDGHMPDMNQRDPLLARYLIQHSLWWIGQYRLDGFRIDTYPYPDQAFMNRLVQEVEQAYPGFFLFGEAWVHSPATQSWFVSGNGFRKGEGSTLRSVTDFQLCFALEKAFMEPYGWTTGVSRIYYALVSDVLNPHADLQVTFVDNHDYARYLGTVKGDMRKFKAGMAILATTRGIPSLYYGTEVGLKETDGHGKIRQDFPGGWPDDAKDKFREAGRTKKEQEAYALLRRLYTWRAGQPAVTRGNLTQFVPDNGVYTYFRKHGDQVVMVTVNGNPKPTALALKPFEEFTAGRNLGRDVLTGSTYPLGTAQWQLDPWETRVLELE